MAVTATYTFRDLCTASLRKIGVVAKDEEADAEDIDVAKDALNRLLKHWQNREIDLPMKASQSVTLTTSATYTMDPVRPLSVDQVNFKENGIERPLERMTREEYDSLPNKASTGSPTAFYYDRQREAAVLYIWPLLATPAGQTLEITYTREFEDVVLTAAADLPGEMWDATVYNLGARLMDDYEINNPRIERMAMKLENEMLSFDREGIVRFASDEYAYD